MRGCFVLTSSNPQSGWFISESLISSNQKVVYRPSTEHPTSVQNFCISSALASGKSLIVEEAGHPISAIHMGVSPACCFTSSKDLWKLVFAFSIVSLAHQGYAVMPIKSPPLILAAYLAVSTCPIGFPCMYFAKVEDAMSFLTFSMVAEITSAELPGVGFPFGSLAFSQ